MSYQMLGGGSPGGLDTQVQYNNAGAVAGAAGLLYQLAASPTVKIIPQGSTFFACQIIEPGSTPPADIGGFPALLHMHVLNADTFYGLGYTSNATPIQWANFLNDFGNIVFDASGNPAPNNGTVILAPSQGGAIGVGNAPLPLTGKVAIGASTGVAGSAPIKLRSGTLLGTPEVGAIEFNTDSLYFTITTGAARKAISLSPYTPPPPVSAWTWINQGGASAVDTPLGVTMTTPPNSGDNIRVLKTAAPATPYTVVMAFRATLFGSNYCSAGFAWRESSSGKLIIVTMGFGNGFTLGISKYNSPTAFDSNYFGALFQPYGDVWIKAQDTGTNRIVSVSLDGVSWTQISLVGNTDFMVANEIGLCVNSNNVTYPVQASFIDWNVF